jgi:alpha-ketoglutarate-dependent taurine dioxygenase
MEANVRAGGLRIAERKVEQSLAALVEPQSGDDLAELIATRRQDVAGMDSFQQSVRNFGKPPYSYVGGGTPRSRVGDEVFTSTEYAPSGVIALHCEASYFREIPEIVWFFCDQPPQAEGETPLGDMRDVLARLDPAIVDRFDDKGLLYVTNLHGGQGFGISWQRAYHSEDREEVEASIRAKNLEHEWTADGGLRVLMRAPGLRRHSVTGRTYWANQASNWHTANLPATTAAALARAYPDPMTYPKNVFYGDGSAIDDADIRTIAATLSEAETTFTWQRGDVLMVDNQAIAHGRRSFKGERRILVSLT